MTRRGNPHSWRHDSENLVLGARQSTIARLQSRPCDSGGPATNRPAPPAHGTTCRPSRRCSRAAVLAGDQRGQRLTGSSTAGSRCEMNHSAHPLALSNHFPPPTDCPGSIRPSSSVKPRGAIHVRTLAPRAHRRRRHRRPAGPHSTNALPPRFSGVPSRPGAGPQHRTAFFCDVGGADAAMAHRSLEPCASLGAALLPWEGGGVESGSSRAGLRTDPCARWLLQRMPSRQWVLRAGISDEPRETDARWASISQDAIYSMHMPCAVHAAIWVHLVGLGWFWAFLTCRRALERAQIAAYVTFMRLCNVFTPPSL